jgi:hypothetical protein
METVCSNANKEATTSAALMAGIMLHSKTLCHWPTSSYRSRILYCGLAFAGVELAVPLSCKVRVFYRSSTNIHHVLHQDCCMTPGVPNSEPYLFRRVGIVQHIRPTHCSHADAAFLSRGGKNALLVPTSHHLRDITH